MSSGAPLNFPDVVFLEDLDPFGREITSDLQGLEQDVAHLIEQVLGSNLDDLTKGAGIREKLSGTVNNLLAAASDIDEQLAGDNRIRSSSTTITATAPTATGAPSYSIVVNVDVDGSVLTLSYSYSATGGVQAQ